MTLSDVKESINTERVLVLGEVGSFHREAAVRYYGLESELVSCRSFADLCESLKSGIANIAFMAIENTIAGLMQQNLTLLCSYDFSIIGEIQLRIELNLVGLPDTDLQVIKTVASHPMALLQSRAFLQQYPHIRTLEVADTATAALNVVKHNDKHLAAIASKHAARVHNLQILAEGIESEKHNYTRFLVLSNQPVQMAQLKDKASIYLELSDKPGSLAPIVQTLSTYKLNIVNIHTIASKQLNQSVGCWLDVTWEDQFAFEEALKIIKTFARSFALKGIYKKSEFLS